jgi:hypothetical protein
MKTREPVLEWEEQEGPRKKQDTKKLEDQIQELHKRLDAEKADNKKIRAKYAAIEAEYGRAKQVLDGLRGKEPGSKRSESSHRS